MACFALVVAKKSRDREKGLGGGRNGIVEIELVFMSYLIFQDARSSRRFVAHETEKEKYFSITNTSRTTIGGLC
jgi:hypothetical protein